MATTVEALRADLLEDIQRHGDAVRFHQGQLAVAEAALSAHDAAVAALEEAREPLSPDTIGPAAPRAPRRNIVNEVYGLLNNIPQTVEALAEAIGGTRAAQVSAAILKLGDKVVHEGAGYIRADMAVRPPEASE